MAGMLVETPWLLLPFLFAIIALSTYLGTTFKLGAALLLIQVVCLDTFYSVVFAPDQIGWAAAGIFGGSVIAFGTIVLFDNWLWPDLGRRHPAGIAGRQCRARSFAAVRTLQTFTSIAKARRRRLPPPTSDLPAHMDLLNRAAAEGVSEHRQAILLAAITRVARIGLEVDRLTVTARQNVPGTSSRDAAARNPGDGGRDCDRIGRDRPRTADARRRWRRPNAPALAHSARARCWTLSLRASSRSDQRISAR